MDSPVFEPQTRASWAAEATRALKGASLDALRFEVEPGILMPPITFAGEASQGVLVGVDESPAQVVQYLPAWDAAEAAQAEGASAFYVATGDVPAGDDWTIYRPPVWGDVSRGLDGLTLREAGATRVETLAWLMLQQCDAGPSPAPMEPLVTVGVGPEWVAEVAFVRAVQVALGGVFPRILAVTLRYHQTAVAPHTNLLRNTLAASAALVGGANALCVQPHDLLAGPTPDGLRRARLTHLVLRDEAHLSRVFDPAGAAYAIDQLTEQFVVAAQARYDVLRHQGTFAEGHNAAALAEHVAAEHAWRQARVLRGDDRIVGVTRSPDASDHVPDLEPLSDAFLAPRRLAEPFEQLRAEVQAASAPAVALYRLESGAMASARVGFARDLFAMAGLASVEVDARDAIPADARAVVLCASDEAYDASGAEALREVAQARPEAARLVAGRPASADALREAGALHFIHARAPLYDHLRETLAALDLIRV